ncbi:hypothetical protein [Sphingomonas phyllosphaerae]|uniref:hypothetical protein n=1 Tax=Sphingomonas phyllosphaerae TaxID=257003 RepID=UPI0003B2F107|nr:hypothetical protein [Sphingomonas phyllosphaerae]
MADLLKRAIREMTRARDEATAAAEELFRRKQDAMDRGDFRGFERYSTTYKAALDTEDKATKRLIAGLTNPDDGDVASLKEATDELDVHLEKLRSEEKSLKDVAVAITALTHVVLLFGFL